MSRAPWVAEKPDKAFAKPGEVFDTSIGLRFVRAPTPSRRCSWGATSPAFQPSAERLQHRPPFLSRNQPEYLQPSPTAVTTKEFSCPKHT